MANKMLIDAAHPEETRVVVLRGNRVEEFDFESANKKPLRGNIYLAKVTRVEPSLQAAFVDYGGNRHGFLAFSEIHPDYYQIPVSDRQALLEEDAAAHRDEEDDDGRSQRRSRRHRRGRGGERAEKRRASEDDSIASTEEAEIEVDDTDVVEAAHANAAPGDDTQGDGPAGEEDAETESDQDQVEAHADSSEESGEETPVPHTLATDPEGFAVVEDVDAVSEASEQDAAIAARDEELDARFRPPRRND
ncbi:MAG TPA: ribonuclease E/G, partial [Methylovirgula sp.]